MLAMKGRNPLLTLCFLGFSQAFHLPIVAERKSLFTLTARYDDHDGTEDQAMEALQSLADFHEGQWKGQATSFSVTADAAAGIVQRASSPPYTSSIKLGADLKNKDFTLTETLEWGGDTVSSRTISLDSSNTDVDSVDGSFSFDSTLPTLPASIVGTDKLPQFLIEHCIALNDDERARCLVLYGMDKELSRVVVCQETRMASDSMKQQSASTGVGEDALTAADLLEMQSDVDRLVEKLTGSAEQERQVEGDDRLKALQNAAAGSSKEPDPAQKLDKHSASLLEMTSGVWLGDLIVRDKPSVPLTPDERGQGFGKSNNNKIKIAVERGFAKWSIGVQKSAWRWMWDFGEEIRQILDFGKAMGADYAGPMESTGGSVCVNEGFSRRIAKDKRMVFVDWSTKDSVSFLTGSFSIQVPRYLNFDSSRPAQSSQPFYTEFGVFQSTPGKDTAIPSLNAPLPDEEDDIGIDMSTLPEVVCSKISRVYNFEGLLKQGCTSFFTLKRFGEEKDE